MKAFWYYYCDYGHRWVIFKDENEEEQVQNTFCQFGHPAVMLQKQRMLDVVEVCIRPAARIVDSVRNQVSGEYEFYLVLRNVNTEEELMSLSPYTWQQAKELADKFRGLSGEKAFMLLKEKKI